jgi:hypothetical protein
VTASFADRDAAVARLAAADEVAFVALKDAPLEDHNDGARTALNLDALPAAPYGLTGDGSRVMVYDSGIVDANHPDFNGRIAQTDADASVPVRHHSTHVAGTVLGSGANSDQNGNTGTPGQFAGMAPGATLATYGSIGSNSTSDVFYDDEGDLTDDAAAAIAGGIDMETMSQGNNTGSNGLPCGQLGDYTNTSIALDELVRGGTGGQQLTFFQSAGNERDDSCAPSGGFRTISSPAPAKNTIVVGAVNSNDNSMTTFSSWGPTDDGRMRPDLVGPGCQSTGDGAITSTGFGDTNNNRVLDPGETSGIYTQMCGTSMSTPAVAGTWALVLEQWRDLGGTRPLPATAKAILVHTADDLGTAGPDYANGFGHVDGRAAADLVRAHFQAERILSDTVDQGATDEFRFASDGAEAPRVTLAWSDPAADRNAASQLVNDLDLVLVAPDGSEHRPFLLDPANPANAATRGDDDRNVVELAVPAAPQAGSWRARVTGASVPDGPQRYSLVLSSPLVTGEPPVAGAGGPYTTDEGDAVVLAGSGSDPDGGSVTYAWDLDDDGQFEDASTATPPFARAGQDGSFPVKVRVTDDEGESTVAASTVTVKNVAPAVGATSDGDLEGALITLDVLASDAGWLDPVDVTVDWGDGSPAEPLAGAFEQDAPKATRSGELTHRYADNGTYTVKLSAKDDDTTTGTQLDLVVKNVAPSVAGGALAPIEEGETASVSAAFTDPGWADTYAYGIDWGTGLGDTFDAGVPSILEEGPLVDRGELQGTHAYGDDGSFTVTTTVSDDDGGAGALERPQVVTNVDPTAAIDETSAVQFGGGKAFLASIGEPVPFKGRSTDPGSDDLLVSWDWDTTLPAVDEQRPYLAGPPSPDGDPSPQVGARDVTDETSHTFAEACLWNIGLRSDDDDAGTASDAAVVLITGNATANRSPGYWTQQASGKKADISDALMACYLKITGFGSKVFDEQRDASTLAKARAVLEDNGSSRAKLDRQLLALWLNFANGATDWTQGVDVTGDKVADMPLSAALTQAEAVRSDPVATPVALLSWKDRLERINLRDQ